MIYQFFAPGDPAPKGSKKFVGMSKAGRGILVESSKRVGPWTAAVIAATEKAVDYPASFEALDRGVTVNLEFVIRQPKYNTDPFPTSLRVGDGDKLTRSTWDGLVRGGLLKDDKFVVNWAGSKRWAETGEQTGCHITVAEVA